MKFILAKYKKMIHMLNRLDKILSITLIILVLFPSVKDSNSQVVFQSEFVINTSNSIIKAIYVEDKDRATVLLTDLNYNIQPQVVDLNDDGILETIIIGDVPGEDSHKVFLLNKDKLASGWPLTLEWNMQNVEILGRMDLDETDPSFIIRYTRTENNKQITRFVAINRRAVINSTFSFDLPGEYIYGTIMHDLNDDGEKEFVLIRRNSSLVYYINSQGQNYTNWPAQVNDTISYIPPLAEDITGDGEPEIIATTDNGFVFAWYLNGTLVDGFPLRFPIKEIHPSEELREMPMIGDFNNDGEMELFIASTFSRLYGISLNPANNKTWIKEIPLPVYITTQGTVYDIDKDGDLEILQLLNDGLVVYGVDEDINIELYYLAGSGYVGTPAIADLDKDNVPEIVLISFYNAIIIENNGILKQSIPRTIAISDTISPLIYDIDNDHEIEIVTVAAHGYVIIKEVNDYGVAPWISDLGSPTHTINYDNDNDGLFDYEERIIGTEIDNNDSDGDTVSDGLEVNQYVLNPLTPDMNADVDEDTIPNIDEVDVYHTNPLNPDSDFDGLTDGEEIFVYFTNAFSSDTDEDGIPDKYEIDHPNILDPNNPNDAFEDPDGDGLLNVHEVSYNTDPEDPDTDDDGLTDGDEVLRYYTNPLIPDADADIDGDGLTNVQEVDIYGTDPSLPDSDGDGYTDGEEVAEGTDPLDKNSFPIEVNYSWAYSFLALIPIGAIISFIVRKRIIRRKLL